jgi:hypothetical protein
VQAAVYVAAIIMVGHGVALLLTYIIMRTSVRIAVPWRSIGNYVLASTITAATLYALPHPVTLAWTFATLLTGAAMCAALLLAIDRDARMLVRSVLREIGISPKKAG